MANNQSRLTGGPRNGLSPEQRLNNNRLFLTLFLVVEGLLFGSLVFSNFSIRSANGDWPPTGISRMDMAVPLLFTVALIVSSVTALSSVAALKRGERANFVRLLGATFVLGAGYVVGMLNLIAHLQFTGVYSAMFVAMWGMHVAHAIGGLLFLGYVWMRAAQGRYSAEAHWSVEAATNFWHFLDLVWIGLFIVLYLI